MHVFKLCRSAEWKTAKHDGVYTGTKMDRGYGFIHLYTEEQLPAMLAQFAADKDDLILIEIDAEKINRNLRFERMRTGSGAYPHLYDILTLDAVVKAGTPVRQADGKITIQ
jgi:uncharacterized protein (DUF952 family)